MSSLPRSDRVRDVCERGSLPSVHRRMGFTLRRSSRFRGFRRRSCCRPPLEMFRMWQRNEMRRNQSNGRSSSGLMGWRKKFLFVSRLGLSTPNVFWSSNSIKKLDLYFCNLLRKTATTKKMSVISFSWKMRSQKKLISFD